MDGRSGLNLTYLDTFRWLGFIRDQLQSSPHPFYGVAPSKQSDPLELVTLHVTFRDASNYCTETLAFEVVDFSGPYHIILGQPCYVKFMAIPSYTYLKLKIPGPTSVITVEAKTQRVLDCEQNSFEQATTTVVVAKLWESCLCVPPPSADPAMPALSSTFKAAEDAKVVQIDAEDPTKTFQIGASLNPK
jgi:hypothetical protein